MFEVGDKVIIMPLTHTFGIAVNPRMLEYVGKTATVKGIYTHWNSRTVALDVDDCEWVWAEAWLKAIGAEEELLTIEELTRLKKLNNDTL